MDSKLITLKLVLDELQQSSDISDMNQRLRIQKIIYLSQLFDAADLGYRYNWYIKGPYSPSLTQDYYALGEAISGHDRSFADRELLASVKRALKKAKKLLEKPADVELDEVRWFELLASLDYLKRVSGYDDNKAVETIQTYKPYLSGAVATALEHLKRLAPKIN